MQILLEDLFNSMGLLERLNSVLIMYLLSDNKDIHEVIHRRYLRYRKINLLATSALYCVNGVIELFKRRTYVLKNKFLAISI